MMYLIEHSDDFSEMPESWKVWQRVLNRNARVLYEALIGSEIADLKKAVPDRHLAHLSALSSRNALHVALKALETSGFLGLFEDSDEGVTTITVGAPPPLTEFEEQAFDVISVDRAETLMTKERKLCSQWQQGFEDTLHERYTLSPGDHASMLRLVKREPDWDAIAAVIKWYWRYGYDDERMSLAYFCKRFPEFEQKKAVFEGNLV